MIFPVEWPAWVSTEDGDTVWIRQGPTASAALADACELTCDEGRYALMFEERVAMVRPILPGPHRYEHSCDWTDSPLLYETDDPDPQEAVMYGRYCVDEAWGP
jgi:hypothetical protein